MLLGSLLFIITEPIATNCAIRHFAKVSLLLNMYCANVAACCSVLQCIAVYCSALHCVAVRCSVLQCVAESCSVLQCVAVYRMHCVNQRYSHFT